MNNLSQIAKLLIGQPMFKLLNDAQVLESEGKKIYHLEIGDPNFDSPEHAKEAAKEAIDRNMTHYTSSMGLYSLRKVVAERTCQYLGFNPSIDQILICPANAIIDFAVRCIVNPGEEVVIPSPGFPTYHSVIRYNQMIPKAIALRDDLGFRMNPNDIEKSISDKTRLIIINNPHNPTGAVMTPEDIENIYNIAKDNQLYILSDEVYSQIVFEDKHFSPCIYDSCRERTILLNSLSKLHSMSGWRLGYAIGPVHLIQKIGLLFQTIFSCMPEFTQIGGAAALLNDHSLAKKRLSILRKRRNSLIDGLNLLPGISCSVPKGAFYLFANIKDMNMSSENYAKMLLHETGVCVLPGNYFGDNGEGFVRLCYASITQSEISNILFNMRKFHNKYCCRRC